MKISDISPVLRLPDQVQVLRVRDMVGPLPLQFDAVREQLTDALIREKSNELSAAEVKRIEQANPVAIDQIVLESLVTPRVATETQ
jgi:hypothetical protein